MIQKREMFARISKYFEECANHEVYVELMGKLNGFNSIFNFWYRSYERQKDKELCSELKDIKQLAEQLTELIQTYFTVFHASQIEGIGEYIPPEINEIESHKKAEKIISDSGAKINYGGGEAYYSPLHDYIQMPPKDDFKSTENYYSTLLHELTHWTGHSSQLNRNQNGGKYSKDYAFEELIAEMGSMFVVSSAGIIQTDGEFQNHASYVDSWLKNLKRDSNYIFKAAAEANKAANFLLKNEEENIDEIDACATA